MFVNGIAIVLSGSADSYAGMSIARLTKIDEQHVLLSVPKSAWATQRLLIERLFTVMKPSSFSAQADIKGLLAYPVDAMDRYEGSSFPL